MAFDYDYRAPEPVPTEEITRNLKVTVPVWRSGEIIDWATGVVSDKSSTDPVNGDTWQIYVEDYHLSQTYYGYSINKHVDKSVWLPSTQLNWYQQASVEHLRGLNVPASWFVGERNNDGSVEVVAIGSDNPTFVWSFRIACDGEYTSSEANDVEFSTGIVV